MNERGPRWTSLNYALDRVRDGSISSHAHHVALTLAVYYANDRGEAWPSQSTLAAATGLTENTVRKAIRELEQHGLITVRKGPPAHTYGNVYTLRNPAPRAGFRRERKSVSAKHCEASETTRSPLSDAGVLVLTCLPAPRAGLAATHNPRESR